MGTYIVKCDRDTDLYCTWSSIVDAPTFIGTRTEIATDLADEFPRIREDLDRADENGVSIIPRYADGTRSFDWDDHEFMVMNGPGAPGNLQRSDLTAYCRALMADDEEKAAGLVAPFDEDDEETA